MTLEHCVSIGPKRRSIASLVSTVSYALDHRITSGEVDLSAMCGCLTVESYILDVIQCIPIGGEILHIHMAVAIAWVSWQGIELQSIVLPPNVLVGEDEHPAPFSCCLVTVGHKAVGWVTSWAQFIHP